MPTLHSLASSFSKTILCLCVLFGCGLLSDSVLAGSLEVDWDPVVSPQLAGYRIKYGSATQTYSQSVDVGNATAYELQGLNDQTTYYLVVVAYDASGVEGLPSAEASGTTSDRLSILAVNAGGPALGSFAADANFSGGVTASTVQPIETTTVTNPAPAAVYQTERFGSEFSYTFANLTAGSAYDVRLHFAEFNWTSVGQRKFNVAINDTLVLQEFDILAAAGGPFKPTIQQFPALANSDGQIVVRFFQGSSDLAKSSAVELIPAQQSIGDPVEINCGGTIAELFQADRSFNGGETSVSQDTIDTSSVIDPAPQEVYQSERYGSDFSYVISNLTRGRSYRVRLHFAEAYWSNAGQRKFGVSVNGNTVLKEFDIIAAAGGRDRAVVPEFIAVADDSGRITIRYTAGSADVAKCNGIQIIPAATAAAVNAGGPPAGSFNADSFFSGGWTFTTDHSDIDVTAVMSPVVSSIYTSERVGNFTYTIPNLISGKSYAVRLHFAEIYFTNPGQRKFHVSINGDRVLTNFDIEAASGSAYRAIVQQFAARADNNGQIVIEFSRGSADSPKVNAIEVMK